MMTKHDKERFNKRIGGEVQISADIRVSDFITEGAAYVTITESTESSLYERVCQYALQHGEDLQGMFKDENMNICPVLFVMWLHSEVILKTKSF